VKLNRGKKGGGGKVLAPEYFVFPVDVLREVPRGKLWGKLMFKDIPEIERYRENWTVISEFLKSPTCV
jgi:hypothetical protein